MNKAPVLIIALVGLFIFGCAGQAQEGQQNQIANPASVYCVNNSGTLRIVTDVNGSQIGICTLPNGTQCEEWSFYRSGHCLANSTQNITGVINNVPSGNVPNSEVNYSNVTGPTTGLLADLPAELPDATATENYDIQLTPEGGVPPYTYELTYNENFWYGSNISLSYDNGTFYGTPPYTAIGTYQLEVCISDSNYTQLCGNTTLKILPPPEETWTGTITTTRYECEDIIHPELGWNGRLDGVYTITFTVQGDLERALKGEVGDEINPYYGLNQSGTWGGTDTVGMACLKDYKVVGGSVSNVPIEIAANLRSTGSYIHIEGKNYSDYPIDQTPVLMSGGWQDLSGQGGVGGQWDGITLNATYITSHMIGGTVILNDMDNGTFTLNRQ